MAASLRPPLDAEALALFARKGREGGPQVPQAGEANGVKVRRVLQLTCDLARRPFETLRILDLGCGEGVYAIEAGLRGATVLAIDARTQRMALGAACAARHGLDNVRFEQGDVRRVTRATHGEFDVVYGLGILYHLDVPDVFTVLENVRAMCAGLLIVDTLISVSPGLTVSHRDVLYEGERCREHADDDPEDVRRSRVLKSIDNPFSFRFSRPALARALHDVGFSSVLECYVPPEPLKPVDRITLAALAGERVSIATYPWINGLSEREVAETIAAIETGGAVTDPTRDDDLTAWIGRLFEHPELLTMAHNQRAGDLNLGLGWLYYALARVVHPRRAVVIGSYRGFVPLLLGRAFQDNREPGEVTLVDPSMVDEFWKDAEATRAYFGRFGVENVRHFEMTTQQFVETEDYRRLGEIGLLFIDGYHSAEQARFDYQAFEGRLASHGIVLFHDSMNLRRSDIYGADRAYDVRVQDFIAELKRDPGLQLFDLPYGTGLTLVRKQGEDAATPLLEGRPGRH